MKLFDVNTWPVAVRWILFMPVSILAFMLFYLFSYIGDLRYPRGAFIFLFMIQLIGRPLTAYVGMYIVPKAKKIIGYLYVCIYIIDLISNIAAAIDGSIDFDLKFISNSIGILIGSIITLYVIHNMIQEQKSRKATNLLKNVQPSRFSSFIDPRDGIIYKTVKIGHQIWMAENLRFIPYLSSLNEHFGIWVYNYNGQEIKDAITTKCYIEYGCLYDWETAKLVCPTGWHLPTDDEWTKLTDYLGGSDLAGGKLKSMSGWENPNIGATNESGFSALPAGYFNYFQKAFYTIGKLGHWWSSTEDGTSHVWGRTVMTDNSIISRHTNEKSGGFSMRCVRD